MSIVESSECFECQKEIDLTTAVADPNGNPLCKDCFKVLVAAGKQAERKTKRRMLSEIAIRFMINWNLLLPKVLIQLLEKENYQGIEP